MVDTCFGDESGTDMEKMNVITSCNIEKNCASTGLYYSGKSPGTPSSTNPTGPSFFLLFFFKIERNYKIIHILETLFNIVEVRFKIC